MRQSLTWDQGPQTRDWKQVKFATDIDVFFCHPHKPSHRGTNENTVSVMGGPVGLARQAGVGNAG
jgi:IS30 family transposase